MANTETHLNCPTELKITGTHLGLYCRTHGTWIKWLNKQERTVALTQLAIPLAQPNKNLDIFCN